MAGANRPLANEVVLALLAGGDGAFLVFCRTF